MVKINVKCFLFLLQSMDLISQLQTYFGITTNFVNGVFFNSMHLTCNKFNVHGIRHMKHVPSMSPFHQKIGFLLPPMESPWTFCVSSHSSTTKKEMIFIILINWGQTDANTLDSRFFLHALDAYA